MDDDRIDVNETIGYVNPRKAAETRQVAVKADCNLIAANFGQKRAKNGNGTEPASWWDDAHPPIGEPPKKQELVQLVAEWAASKALLNVELPPVKQYSANSCTKARVS